MNCKILQQQADDAGRAECLHRKVEGERLAGEQVEAEVVSLNRGVQLVEEELDQAQEHHCPAKAGVR